MNNIPRLATALPRTIFWPDTRPAVPTIHSKTPSPRDEDSGLTFYHTLIIDSLLAIHWSPTAVVLSLQPAVVCLQQDPIRHRSCEPLRSDDVRHPYLTTYLTTCRRWEDALG